MQYRLHCLVCSAVYIVQCSVQCAVQCSVECIEQPKELAGQNLTPRSVDAVMKTARVTGPLMLLNYICYSCQLPDGTFKFQNLITQILRLTTQ